MCIRIAQVVIFVCSNSLDRFSPYKTKQNIPTSPISFFKFQLDFSLPFVQHFRLFFRLILLHISRFSSFKYVHICTMAKAMQIEEAKQKQNGTSIFNNETIFSVLFILIFARSSLIKYHVEFYQFFETKWSREVKNHHLSHLSAVIWHSFFEWIVRRV